MPGQSATRHDAPVHMDPWTHRVLEHDRSGRRVHHKGELQDAQGKAGLLDPDRCRLEGHLLIALDAVEVHHRRLVVVLLGELDLGCSYPGSVAGSSALGAPPAPAPVHGSPPPGHLSLSEPRPPS
eukprot:10275464-Alexandrium_andersonii.AAC.1